MKQFKIYTNPQGTYEAVKQGWSWPAFFFDAIWALVKKMYALGGILIAIYIILAVIEELAGINLLGFIGEVIISIVFGIKGNEWRENNLTSRGYEYKGAVNASTPEGAIALYMKESDSK